MAEDFETKFIGDKISRIKFMDPTLGSEVFITGTYDSTGSNNISLWRFMRQESEEEDGNLQAIVRAGYLPHRGDVLGLDCNGSVIASSSSNGDVNLIKLNKLQSKLESVHSWENLHSYSNTNNTCPCTDLSFEDYIATCGEDGSVNILDVSKSMPVRQMTSCDSSVLSSIIWVTQQNVAVVNTCGQLKIFDIRQSGSQPTQTFILSGDLNVINCLAKHPSQNHIIATGTYSGMLGIFDLRQDNVPVTILEGHAGSSISDIQFHPTHSDRLFTSASDGTVWQWNPANNQDGDSAWWLFTDAAKHKVEVHELTSNYPQAHCMTGFEVNCLDVCNSTCVCGSDNGAICVFYDLNI